MSKKGINVKQHDITDCGAACLASVCAYFGLQFPVSRIRQYAFTDQKGTNVLGLIEAANKLGFSAKGVRAQFEALKIVPKPVIAHVVVKNQLQHFIIMIYSVLWLSTSVYIGKITDYVLIDKNTNLLNLMGVVMIVILLLRTFIGAMKSILALKTGQRIDAALILGYYKHLLTLPQQFFDTMRVGEIISRVNDAVKIRNFINNVSLDLVVNVMILLFSVCLMFVYSWQLALITLFSAPLFFSYIGHLTST